MAWKIIHKTNDEIDTVYIRNTEAEADEMIQAMVEVDLFSELDAGQWVKEQIEE